MAKQAGLFPLRGTIDNVTFYKDPQYGFRAKKKSKLTGERVLTEPQFERTRENATELGRASTYGKKIRKAFQLLVNHCTEQQQNTNLVARLLHLIKEDTVSDRGQRVLTPEALRAFRHFELNSRSLSEKYFINPFDISDTQDTLSIQVEIDVSSTPLGIDAWKVISVSAPIEWDDTKSGHPADVQCSSVQRIVQERTPLIFTHPLHEESLNFHGMAIHFFRYDPLIRDFVLCRDKTHNSGFIRFLPLRPDLP